MNKFFSYINPKRAKPASIEDAGALRIDTLTKDYIYNPQGNLEKQSQLANRMQILISTSFQNALADTSIGMSLPKKIDNRFIESMKSSVAAALSELTTVEELIDITNIDIKTSGSRAKIEVFFIDKSKTDGQEEGVTVSL